MDGWDLAGWALIYVSATAFVGQIFGMTGKAKKSSLGGLLVIFIIGEVMESENSGIAGAGEQSKAWPILFLWLAFMALIGTASAIQRWYSRYKAIRLEQKADAQAVAIAATLPPTITCPEFDILLTYAAKGKKPEDRRVTIHTLHIERNDAGRPVVTRFAGYCHLRHGPRTFNVTGIVEMADAETGEVIADHGEWLLNRALPDQPSVPARGSAGLGAGGTVHHYQDTGG